MSIKVHLLTEGAEPPEDRLHYVLASNGAFLALENDWVKALVPAKDIQALEAKATAQFKVPPMPKSVLYQVVNFFKQVRDKHQTEVAVLLHYSAEKGWAVSVPEQEVTGGHVSYKIVPGDRIPGYKLIGTMHSHVDMSAHHSSVDTHDEAEFDGLHVTLGKMDVVTKGLIDVDAELVIRGHREKLEHEQWTDGLAGAEDEEEAEEAADDHWWNRYGIKRWRSGPSHKIIDRAALKSAVVPKEWHDKVTVHKWSYADAGGDYRPPQHYSDYGYDGGYFDNQARNNRRGRRRFD